MGCKTQHEVSFARAGSFDIRIAILEPGPARERTFSLAAGITPGVASSMRKWFISVVAPEQAEALKHAAPTRAPEREVPEKHGRWKTVTRPSLF
ncbi:MAG TPA: hypothetical protein VG297_06570 [Bryobacteraceae bacterium]|nr:hypothetical protein [Bryobacteraceae bacterium]